MADTSQDPKYLIRKKTVANVKATPEAEKKNLMQVGSIKLQAKELKFEKIKANVKVVKPTTK
jgi:hypothetical protein